MNYNEIAEKISIAIKEGNDADFEKWNKIRIEKCKRDREYCKKNGARNEEVEK